MASKSRNISRAMSILALSGLFAGAIIRLYFHGLEKNLGQENLDHFGLSFVRSISSSVYDVTTSLGIKTQDGILTLTVKFLHFFVAKSLQFRYLSVLQPAPFTTSMLFWVSFTRAISSMSNDALL